MSAPKVSEGRLHDTQFPHGNLVLHTRTGDDAVYVRVIAKNNSMSHKGSASAKYCRHISYARKVKAPTWRERERGREREASEQTSKLTQTVCA